MLGDFNYNFVNDKSINNAWNNILNSYSLQQLVDKPTRVTSNSETIVDHLYSNMPCNIIEVNIPKLSISDHYPVCFTRKIRYNTQNGPMHKVIKYRSMKTFNESSFRNSLENQPWSVLEAFDDPDDALDYFIQIFQSILNEHVPVKEKRVKHQNQPDWFNLEISEVIKARNKAKRSGNMELYKNHRNKVSTLIFHAKKTFYSNVINKNKNNPKILWKNLKDLSGKSTVHQSNIIQDEKGTPIMDPKDAAEAFNHYFSNVFKSAPSINNKINNHDFEPIKTFVKNDMINEEEFAIPKITWQFIEKELKSLDPSK